MNFIEVLYGTGWRVIQPLLVVAGMLSPKLARAVAGRRESVDRFREWGIEHRTGADLPPLLVLHGASAGELAGAVPILDELRRLNPDLQLVVTYSSPSGEGVAADIHPDMHWFVPFDRPDHAGAVLDALRPDALVFAKLDVWPTLTRQASRRGIPIGMINATVRPGSGRLKFPGRQLLRAAYGSMEAVGAVSDEERERLIRLGVPPTTIQVTGDASFDRAIHRAEASRKLPPRLPPGVPGTLRLIAGSTWLADEKFLLDAVSRLPEVELVLVPHEPTQEHVERLAADVMRMFGVPARIWSRLANPATESASSSPLIVDAVGFLAELYAEADVAYVGGGLDGTGLHSVIEPAAAGLPVLYGARHDRWEARELTALRGAAEVDPSNVVAVLTGLGDGELRESMATAGRAYVESKSGAAVAGSNLIKKLLDRE